MLLKLLFAIFSGLLIISVASNNNDFSCAKIHEQCDRQTKPCCNKNFSCIKKSGGKLFSCEAKAALTTTCNANDKCSVEYSICSEYGACVCKHNYIELSPTECAPLLNESCIDRCAVDDSECIDGYCKCKRGYMPRSNVECLPKLHDVYCHDNSTCQVIKFSECSPNHLCTCISNAVAVSATRCASTFGGFCKVNSECELKNSVCIDNKCKCRDGFVYNGQRMCNRGHLGMYCHNNKDCDKIITHSICLYNNECFCNVNYQPVNGTICLRSINKNCFDGEQCALENSACIENKCQCIPKYVFSDDKCKPLYLNELCTNDNDCDEIKNAKCSNDKKCVCNHAYRQVNSTTCGPKVSGICHWDEQCMVANSACIDGKCQCSRNYFAVLNEECIAEYLGQSCTKNADCRKIPHGKCSKDKYCVCQSNYAEFNSTVCAPSNKGFCDNDETCLFDNFHCVDNECQCKPGFWFQNNGKCISDFLGMECKIDENCQEIRHSKCSEDKKCVCRSNTVILNPITCAPQLGGFCWDNDECVTENSVCIDKKCQCNKNFLKRDYKCLPRYLGQPCKIDDDCAIIKYAVCSEENICVCKSHYVANSISECRALISEHCDTTNDCFPQLSVCIDNKCQCQNSYSSLMNRACVANDIEYQCSSNNDCWIKKNSYCSANNRCSCKPTHVSYSSAVCAPLLGEICEKNEICATDHAFCRKGKCQCNVRYVKSDDQCLPKHLGVLCKYSDDCKKIKYAQCNINVGCFCIDGYVQLNKTTCAPLLGKFCSSNSECATANANCIDNTCQCSAFFTPVSNNQCVAEDLTETFCSYDNDCRMISNARCTDLRKCDCKSNYVSVNATTCLPLLGGFCNSNNDCATTNSICIAGKCQCKKHFKQKSKHHCVLLTLGQSCDNNNDCAWIPNAVCSDKICICAENYTGIDEDTCLPNIGSSCGQDHHCRYNTIHCVDYECQCRPGFLPVSPSQCTSQNETHSCNEDLDCGDPWHGQCYNNRCICRKNHVATNSWTCSPLIGGLCWKDDQCVPKNSICIDYHCRCKDNFIAVANNLCLPGL